MKKRTTVLIILISITSTGFSQQPQFSLATDLGVQRNFKKGQQYWAVGHTIQTQFNFTPKNGVYLWISYYSSGKFNNINVTADAKSILTVPPQINYQNKAAMRSVHFSAGWKKYLKGACNAEESWSIYSYAGFGLLLGSITNAHSLPIDTSLQPSGFKWYCQF